MGVVVKQTTYLDDEIIPTVYAKFEGGRKRKEKDTYEGVDGHCIGLTTAASNNVFAREHEEQG